MPAPCTPPIGALLHPLTLLRAWVLGTGLILGLGQQVSAQVLLDDFNRPTSTTVGNGWTESETVAAGAQIVTTSGQQTLQLGSTTSGREIVSQDLSGAGLYNPQFNLNTCLMTWAFCVRQSRADPSGFAAGSFGVAYVLGSTGSALATAGQGYAVMIGQATAVDPLRLVRFNGGLAGALTSIITPVIAPYSDLSGEYLAVKVTYDPVTNTWQMFASTIAAGTFSTTNPTTAATALGSAVNATYTGTSLPFTGCLWNHATTAGEAALFDNVYVPQNCTPTVNFATAAASANESVGTITVTLNLFPATSAAGTITVTVADGPGMVYGVDYTSTPAVVGADITVPVAAGATTATFQLTIVDDALDEGNENISFTITGTSGGGAGGILMGPVTSYLQTIIDNDGPPSVNFTTTTDSNVEGVPSAIRTFTLNISPAPTVGGSITIQVTNGPGASNPADYLTNPATIGGFITVPYLAGATSVTFTATVINDVVVESTEQITFTITAITGGPLATVGITNVATLSIGDNDSPAATLTSGDLAIVGINANNFACGGGSGEDYISFFCFKPITTGTTIILSDNGYERCIAGRWGNTEGTVLMTRTGIAIPAGQVITFRVSNSSGSGNVIGAAPDAAWTCASLNGGTSVNMNVGGDQIFFMQGGTWTTNTVGGHDAQYSGNVLYGFSTYPTFPWTASCATNPNQRSNLPLGMNCFSMAPTSATDFSKYTGTLAAATQRDWMIRIDSPANWTSPGTCAGYNSASPNWLTAPILPIIVGGFTQGLWRGTTSNDWFDCKNWDDVEVPLATTNVTISQVATQSCVVGVTPGGTAVCASLNQTNAGTPINLTVQNSSSLAIGGPLTIQRTAAGFPITLTVSSGTLTATNLTVQGMTADEAVFRNQVPTNTVIFSGNLTIGTGGLVDLQGAGVGGRVFVGGNYTNQGPTETTLDELYGSVVFNGAAAQSINASGFQEVFYDLGIAKPSGNVTLNTPIAVSNNLDLSNGLLISSATNLPSILAGGSTNNATDLSFVDGPLEKIGNTSFTFPVGKGSSLRPCGIAGVTGVLTDAFTAEYFPISAYTWGSNLEAPLHHISDCEYWIIERSAGSADAVVELTWDTPESCVVDALADLRVARWDAAALPAPIWRDRGNGGACCSPVSGTIPTALQQTLFGPWTLASINGNNPLPVELIDFTAKPEDAFVRLDWTTGSEEDNAYFTIERSGDGISFEPIISTPGAGNSTQLMSYTDLDRAPLNGMNYYRLRQTDADGTSSLSAVVTVLMGWGGDRPLVVFGNTDVLTALHSFPAGSRFTMQDMTGRLIADGTTEQDGLTLLYVGGLQHGAYLLRLSDGQRAETVRFVY
ncbi:MAG: Calx-beta domain-containing protein [Flavobacteriales bacterium]